jgi:uncharacterized delta-60 repeat protein
MGRLRPQGYSRAKTVVWVFSVALMFAIMAPIVALSAPSSEQKTLNLRGGIAMRAISYPGSRILLLCEFPGEEEGLILLSANGSVDRSFGSNGERKIPWRDVTVEHHGKILVLATAPLPEGQPGRDITVTRLQPNGTLDPTFGRAGVAAFSLGQSLNEGTAIAMAPKGKIWISGTTMATTRSEGVDEAVIGRLRPDGSLDQTFGRAGLKTVISGNEVFISAVASLPDGGVLVNVDSGAEIIRLGRGGAFANAFGEGGRMKPETNGEFFGGSEEERFAPIEQLGVLPDGGFILAGTLSRYLRGHLSYSAMAVRYQPNGEVDGSYGSVGDGYAKLTVRGQFFASNFAVERNGSLLVGGQFNSDLAAAEFKPDGRVDRSFGHRGYATVEFGGEGGAEPAGIAIQNPSLATLVGYSVAEGRQNDLLVLARLRTGTASRRSPR